MHFINWPVVWRRVAIIIVLGGLACLVAVLVGS